MFALKEGCETSAGAEDGLTGADWADWFDICVILAAMQCICSTQATRGNS